MNLNDYLDFETKRQSGTAAERAGMRDAYDLLLLHQEISEVILCTMAWNINPNVQGYRQVPAYFAHGGHAINYRLIPQAMKRFVEAANLPESDFVEYSPGFKVQPYGARADFLTKEFLLIHPFADGNGRVGSLLWNFLNRTLDDPEPMPYFFGDN